MDLMNTRRIRRGALPVLCAGAVTAIATLGLGGCNDAQAGALFGTGIGALAGQAIGHDTESTLIGAGVGAAGGYIIGNESDKAKQRRYYNPNYDY